MARTPKYTHKQVGERIREARDEAGMTGKELAGRIGWSQSFMSDIETGRKTPSLERLISISDALKVSPLRLMEKGTK